MPRLQHALATVDTFFLSYLIFYRGDNERHQRSPAATPPAQQRRLDHTSMNQRKRPSSAGSSRELRRRRVVNNQAFPISDVRSPLDSTPIYRPTPPMYLTLRGAVVAAAARASGPHLCHARPPGSEQNRRRLALLPPTVANRHRFLRQAPEAWRLRQRRRPEVDEHAARAPRRRAPSPSARDRRDMAR